MAVSVLTTELLAWRPTCAELKLETQWPREATAGGVLPWEAQRRGSPWKGKQLAVACVLGHDSTHPMTPRCFFPSKAPGPVWTSTPPQTPGGWKLPRGQCRAGVGAQASPTSQPRKSGEPPTRTHLGWMSAA